jgi:hypothetical protein
MSKNIHQGGGFTIARKIFHSNIWLKQPLYLKVWIWIIGRASYMDHERRGHKYKRGEFVTTYDEIIKATAYRHNRRHVFPTIKQIRIILKWLEAEGMISVKPLKSGPFLTGADTGARTRAYIGLKIVVINYDSYQDLESYKGRHKGRDLSQQGQYNNKGIIKDKTPLDFFSLKKRYRNPDLIDQAFVAIASTRKCGKVKDSVLFAQLKKWDRHPVNQVESGIRIYLEKDYAGQGKREDYLLGIIRNQKDNKSLQISNTPKPKQRQPTIEELLSND